MNFRRRPFLCTTLYRNPMQVSNFGGTFDQLFLWSFLWNFHRRCISTFSIPWCKKVKNDQKLKSRGGPALRWPTALKMAKNWKFEFLPQTYLKLFLTTPSLSSEIKMKIILFVLELGPFLFAHSFKESHCRSCEISLYLLCSHFCPREPKTVEFGLVFFVFKNWARLP